MFLLPCYNGVREFSKQSISSHSISELIFALFTCFFLPMFLNYLIGELVQHQWFTQDQKTSSVHNNTDCMLGCLVVTKVLNIILCFYSSVRRVQCFEVLIVKNGLYIWELLFPSVHLCLICTRILDFIGLLALFHEIFSHTLHPHQVPE